MRSRRSAALLSAATCLALLAGCSGSDDESSTDDAAGGECAWVESGQAPAKDVELPGQPGDLPQQAVIATSAGDVTITFDTEKRCTVASFASLVEQGYYDETPCHRVSTPEAGYGILQCGDPTGSGSGGPGYTIPDELTGDETYAAGTLAMANTGAPDSGGGQFFLTYADSGFPPAYTEFGTIDDAGIAVLEKIADAGTEGGAPDGPPAEPVEITGVTLS